MREEGYQKLHIKHCDGIELTFLKQVMLGVQYDPA